MSSWAGMKDCSHYGGIKRVTEKFCCGGRKREKVLINCAIHKRIYSMVCKEGKCPYYEKGDNNGGEG